tara:strand:- start:419 stop:646 length:228 start_codon:yes stop_codon:yes gene_type:complete
MKNTYKILMFCFLFGGLVFSRTSGNYTAPTTIEPGISFSHQKTISEYDDSMNEGSLKWKRRHKRRKKMRRKKRGM